MNIRQLTNVCNNFGLTSNGISFGSGHINDTFYANKDGRPCVLQKINTSVFTNPKELMENIISVTDYLRHKLTLSGENAARSTLEFVRTKDGSFFYSDENGDCFRAYFYIDNTITYDTVSDSRQFYEAARTFGHFQNMLSDFPAEKLFETIKNFHDTPSRVMQLKEAVQADFANCLTLCENEIAFAMAQANEMDIVAKALQTGAIPHRVTHNDTKLNNILFDVNTKKGICVIDLDTIMPGSLLYDFGDALRYGANTADEDETDLEKVTLDLTLFEAYTKGYAAELKHTITKEEKELLSFSAKLLTYECGIRFLTDFLNGNTYFKVKYKNHNLDRAKNQFKLFREIDSKMHLMEQIVKENF